jgi:hypothetical protein
VQDNLRKWKTGSLRRRADGKPFGDVIGSHPTRRTQQGAGAADQALEARQARPEIGQ